MNGKQTLFLDQYGNKFWAKTIKELRSQIGGGGSCVSRMYCDLKSGGCKHVGWVIGDHWLTPYQAAL